MLYDDLCPIITDFVTKSFYKANVSVLDLDAEESFELMVLDALSVWKLPMSKISYDYLNKVAIGYYQDIKICNLYIKKNDNKKQYNHIYYENRDFCFCMENFDKKEPPLYRNIEKIFTLLIFLAEHYRSWLFLPQNLFQNKIQSIATDFGFHIDEIYKMAELMNL